MKKSAQTATNKLSGPSTGPYNTRCTKKLEGQSKDKKNQAESAAQEVWVRPEASHVSDPTISSANKQKKPLKKSSTIKQEKDQKEMTMNSKVSKSKSERKKEKKNEVKNSSREEDKGPFGVDEPTQKDIKTSKRYAAQEIFNDQILPEPQPESQLEVEEIGDENNRGKPSPKKSSKAPISVASSTESAITKRTGQKTNIAPTHKEEEEEDIENQKQQQRQEEEFPILTDSTNPALPESLQPLKDTKAKSPSPSPSPSQRPRSESNDEKLPGAASIKKLKGKRKAKGISESTMFARGRHILKSSNDALSFEELKTIALEMLESGDIQQECEWIFASRVQTNLWMCNRKLTHGVVKRFGLVREDMPEKERHSSWTQFDSSALRHTYQFEQIYVNPKLKGTREVSIGTKDSFFD